MKSILLKLIGLLVGLGLLASTGGYWYINQVVKRPMNINNTVEFAIPTGESFSGFLAQLARREWYQQVFIAKLYARLQPNITRIKAGTYEAEVGDSLLSLLARVTAGKEKQFAINLVEGLTWKTWLEQIKANANLEDDLGASVVTASLNGVVYESIEGLLLPDTYFFTRGTKASELVRRANNALGEFLAQSWQNRAIGLPYDTPYEALILASIIEKETGIAQERPRIAGVFVNRLHENMRLQTDPTVIYGMGDSFDGNIRRADLRRKTPYNTYVIKGLPPTPIAMPSKAAILAALTPLETDEFYFVSKGDGSHQFSVTLAEHNAAVRKYQLNK